MPQTCHGSIINGTSITAHHNDHQQGRRTNNSQEGNDGTNNIMKEASEMMFDEQGDANDDNVADMPKHKRPITTSMRRTSDCHHWELALHEWIEL